MKIENIFLRYKIVSNTRRNISFERNVPAKCLPYSLSAYYSIKITFSCPVPGITDAKAAEPTPGRDRHPIASERESGRRIFSIEKLGVIPAVYPEGSAPPERLNPFVLFSCSLLNRKESM